MSITAITMEKVMTIAAFEIKVDVVEWFTPEGAVVGAAGLTGATGGIGS